MKKFLVVAFMLLGLTSAKALEGVNLGVSLMAGVFEVDGASEKFSGAHSSGASPGDVTKTSSTNGEDADTPTGPTLQVGDPVTWTYEIVNTGSISSV